MYVDNDKPQARIEAVAHRSQHTGHHAPISATLHLRGVVLSLDTFHYQRLENMLHL